MEIKVEVIYALQDCISELGCDIGFRLLNYKINTPQVPSITESGYMNTNNYEQLGRASSTMQAAQNETYTFTLDPSDTGFYVALQDTGTCVGISRLRVYHYNCPSRQEGLVLYPETPAPANFSSVDVRFTCVDNAHTSESESDTTTCHSNGTWATDIPVCECNLGYENRGTECFSKSVRELYSCYRVFTVLVFFYCPPKTYCEGMYKVLFCTCVLLIKMTIIRYSVHHSLLFSMSSW